MCQPGEEKNCSNCDNRQACVPFFIHENSMMHYSKTNKRMLVALLAVCITFILTIIIFVHGYTVREKNWLDTLTRVTTPGVTDGVQQDADS